MSTRPALLVLFVAACGGDSSSAPDAPGDVGPTVPTANTAREILDTRLAFDVTAKTGTVVVMFGPSTEPGATVEVGDLVLDSVQFDGADLAYTPRLVPSMTRHVIDLALPPSDEPTNVTFTVQYKDHRDEGVSATGYTLLWPYYCGNLFPCHSDPADGTTLSLSLTGVPADKVAVYPTMVGEAPSYQIAWSVDAYTELPLGTTDAGTELAAWYRPNEQTQATTGTQHLRDVFDWYEKTLGPYRFGPKAGGVSVDWGANAYGGMEHHPYWHVGSSAMGDEETHAHEAAHGWYGDGIRLACWEDFVLSEGTVTYLSARALDAVGSPVGNQILDGLASELGSIPGTYPVWPEGCNSVDIIDDNLFTRAPYVRGALFYRAVALKVGVDVLDGVLHDFYMEHAGKPAHMADMLALIETETGFDPTACATSWLRSTTKPTPGACP